ncbi:MAG: formate dehydrogenase subunit alpha [Candidatus Schekmanbacteria bacterium]|nr:MAG: formate dehydrogenase subunit alpha [Candidatus Schekmanbacteria bacterium]
MKRTLTTCPYCGTGCRFYLLTDDMGKVCGVEASTEHHISRGQLCIKGWNAYEFVNHPDRLTTPLIRKNGKLVPSYWQEAIDCVAKRLKEISEKYGSDSLMFFSSAKTTNEENFAMMKLARAVFRTNNIDHCARLCHSSTVAGLAASFGSGAMTNSISCMEKAKCILVIGSNTTEQHPLIGTRIINNVIENGCKLIVADSRAIRLSRFAEIHLRHKNGTDVALLNGIMNIIIKEGLEDKEFISERTENYEELKKTVEKYTPEIVSEITGLKEEEISEAARIFGESKPAMIVYAMGITQHTHGVDNVKSCANLAMLTGNLGVEGGGVNPLRGQNNVQGACDMGALPDVYSGYQKVTDEKVRKKFEKVWRVSPLPDKPGLTATEAISAAAEGKLKALYIMGENPILSDANQNHVRKAFGNLEFIVVQDIFPTSTTEFADVVLPACCYAEKDGTFTSTERGVQAVNKAANPPGNAMDDWKIFSEIAIRLGYNGLNYKSPSEILEEINSLTPSYAGITPKRIKKEFLQWPCPDENHPGTPILHKEKFARGRGKFHAVEFKPSAELPDEKWPLLLSTGRCYFHFHTGTMTRRSKLLDREERFPYVELHPDDAKKIGLADREYCLVSTRRGEIKAMARITDMVIPGIIFMPFHFFEGAANVLTNNALDPESKIPEFKVCAANIRKIEDEGINIC